MNNKYQNKIVTNRKSPANEQAYIDAYKAMNPKATKSDKLDISAVRSKDGTPGHALLNQSINRSKDTNAHRGQDFIPDKDLRKMMKK